MIDFQNASVFKLRRTGGFTSQKMVEPLMVPGEAFIGEYQTVRDLVIFTTKRILCVNVQGVTGKKKDFTSIPYAKIQVFSVETSGVFDMDSELEVYISSIGKITFEFTGNSDIISIGQAIGSFVLR